MRKPIRLPSEVSWLFALGLGAVCVSASASPTVENLIISWPDDGYYQVQRVSDFSTVCEGTRQCSVTSGEYIVINHTTGQRFENIVVSDNPVNGDADYLLVGNSFAFPEGQWFQVQDAGTFNSVCNGERTCEVDPGRYIVINHTLQQRFENILVGTPSEPTLPVSTDPTVIGNIISWADDGWYQVQNSVDYETICEGGRQCTVPVGSYHIINLTTNTRYENIVVGGVDPVDPVPTPGTVPIPAVGEYYPSSISIADATVRVTEDPASNPLPSGSQLVGDINGDGLDDLLVLIERELIYQTSAAILFADAPGNYPDLPLRENLTTDISVGLDHGFLISDVGTAISGVGDINNDGYDDLSLRSSGYFELPTRFIVGGAASFPSRINTADFLSEQRLVQLPISAGLKKAGDINGDGITDLFVASPADVQGGIIYGANEMNLVIATRQDLRELSVFPGCTSDFCDIEPIGDFDGDGRDDIFARRFGANGCGFSGFAVVLYGQAGGIEQADNIYEYTQAEVTRLVDEQGASCLSGSIVSALTGNDIDGDGLEDLFLNSRLSGDINHLVFGMSDRRREFVSVAELDGQLGLNILNSRDIGVRDTNSDGFDDIIFDDSLGYLGHARNQSSVDGPIVLRTPASFVINVPNSLTIGAESLSVSINNVSAGVFDLNSIDITVDDLTGRAEAIVEIGLMSSDNTVLRTLRRVIPAFVEKENLTAVLLAPRMIELSFNGDASIRRYSHYLVWRDGMPIGRSLNGADNYIDQDVELGRSYTYHLTPDYLYDNSLDASMMRGGPLLQRQSNSVSIATPDG